ncbi:MAG: DNA replication/repair protein RecF, partial [Alphaproteobacteria bacterium]|nr:DNA replication/repair protein RecF [Alphaproteobacteria bacterium]
NYARAELHPGPGFNILTGDNGAGKTNILEALSLLAPGRGLRGAQLGEMAQQGGPGEFAISAQRGDALLGTGTRADAPARRIVRINGANAAATALSEWLSIVWLTPAMDRLFTDSAGERRRFLDRLVLSLDPDHAHHSARYEAAMRQRNRLLAQDMPADPHWLNGLEAQMVTHGLAIHAARTALVTLLDAQMAALPDGPFARAQLVLADETPLAPEAYAQALAMGRARDAAAGRTLSGPHRADLLARHAAKNQPAEKCSTGEQKAMLITIVLAHAGLVAEQRGLRPVLLLDEVAAHLDPVRREALFTRLAETGSQVWLTGTEATVFAPLGQGAPHFRVYQGHICRDI